MPVRAGGGRGHEPKVAVERAKGCVDNVLALALAWSCRCAAGAWVGGDRRTGTLNIGLWSWVWQLRHCCWF